MAFAEWAIFSVSKVIALSIRYNEIQTFFNAMDSVHGFISTKQTHLQSIKLKESCFAFIYIYNKSN